MLAGFGMLSSEVKWVSQAVRGAILELISPISMTNNTEDCLFKNDSMILDLPYDTAGHILFANND